MKKIEKFNCVVTIENGKLKICKIRNGMLEMWAGTLNWEDVKGPVSQEFLEEVNKALGTQLSVETFDPEFK